MAFTFTLKPEHGCLPSLAALEAEAKKYDIQFSVDREKGTFFGNGVSGSFTLAKDCIHITVTNKPFLLPETLVKMAISKWFGSLPGE